MAICFPLHFLAGNRSGFTDSEKFLVPRQLIQLNTITIDSSNSRCLVVINNLLTGLPGSNDAGTCHMIDHIIAILSGNFQQGPKESERVSQHSTWSITVSYETKTRQDFKMLMTLNHNVIESFKEGWVQSMTHPHQYVRRRTYETFTSAGFFDSCHGLDCVSDNDVGNVVQINRMMECWGNTNRFWFIMQYRWENNWVVKTFFQHSNYSLNTLQTQLKPTCSRRQMGKTVSNQLP